MSCFNIVRIFIPCVFLWQEKNNCQQNFTWGNVFFVSLPWLRIFSGIPMKMWTESSLWDPLKLQPCKHSSFNIVTVQYGHLCSFLLSVKNSSLEMLWIEQRETTWDFFQWSSHQAKGGQQLLPGSSWDFPQKKKMLDILKANKYDIIVFHSVL